MFESDGRKGHLKFLAFRMYDPLAHQWNIKFATSNVGTHSFSSVGEFKDGLSFTIRNRMAAERFR
jgi:hypothetical protein